MLMITLIYFWAAIAAGRIARTERNKMVMAITFHKILYVSHSYAVILNSNNLK